MTGNGMELPPRADLARCILELKRFKCARQYSFPTGRDAAGPVCHRHCPARLSLNRPRLHKDTGIAHLALPGHRPAAGPDERDATRPGGHVMLRDLVAVRYVVRCNRGEAARPCIRAVPCPARRAPGRAHAVFGRGQASTRPGDSPSPDGAPHPGTGAARRPFAKVRWGGTTGVVDTLPVGTDPAGRAPFLRHGGQSFDGVRGKDDQPRGSGRCQEQV